MRTNHLKSGAEQTPKKMFSIMNESLENQLAVVHKRASYLDTGAASPVFFSPSTHRLEKGSVSFVTTKLPERAYAVSTCMLCSVCMRHGGGINCKYLDDTEF
jgi:hypothetical protein